MPRETIVSIKETIRGAAALPEEKKKKLLNLLGQLEKEMEGLSDEDRESARKIARAAGTSTRRATGEDEDSHRLGEALDDLSETVTRFEASHPGLVAVVNRIADALSDIGI